MADALRAIDAKFLSVAGRLPTEQEQEEAYQELLPLAQAFGHAEAGPEAIGNLAMAGAGKYVYGLGRETIEKLAVGAMRKSGLREGAIEIEGRIRSHEDYLSYQKILSDWLNTESWQKYVMSSTFAAVLGFTEVVPSFLENAGFAFGFSGLRRFGGDLCERLASLIPVNPAHQNSLVVKAAEVLGQILFIACGFMLVVNLRKDRGKQVS